MDEPSLNSYAAAMSQTDKPTGERIAKLLKWNKDRREQLERDAEELLRLQEASAERKRSLRERESAEELLIRQAKNAEAHREARLELKRARDAVREKARPATQAEKQKAYRDRQKRNVNHEDLNDSKKKEKVSKNFYSNRKKKLTK